jgi:hypothetical protein
MADVTELVAAAQAYDLKHRPPEHSWTRVPDTQVLRLLIGAGIVKPDPAPSDEDRIRDAMAEAEDHPGRIITR